MGGYVVIQVDSEREDIYISKVFDTKEEAKAMLKELYSFATLGQTFLIETRRVNDNRFYVRFTNGEACYAEIRKLG